MQSATASTSVSRAPARDEPTLVEALPPSRFGPRYVARLQSRLFTGAKECAYGRPVDGRARARPERVHRGAILYPLARRLRRGRDQGRAPVRRSDPPLGPLPLERAGPRGRLVPPLPEPGQALDHARPRDRGRTRHPRTARRLGRRARRDVQAGHDGRVGLRLRAARRVASRACFMSRSPTSARPARTATTPRGRSRRTRSVA